MKVKVIRSNVTSQERNWLQLKWKWLLQSESDYRKVKVITKVKVIWSKVTYKDTFPIEKVKVMTNNKSVSYL